MDVLDSDGVVFIKNDNKSKERIGQFVNCKIIDVQDYDFIGKILK